ncbi:MAG TPA: M67 family metallopeptidase [Candidatus Acidoferrales bacterium]|nr:M67 family metallopeptidase [Candidatus Acidoferrales bacterium]
METAPRLTLSAEAWSEISRHALECFPEECCGVVVSGARGDQVIRCRNIQNRLHREDPGQNPRDATIAYAMDPRELAAILSSAEASGARLKAFYHSHPNHDAYFSEEDKAGATPFGEPTYPEAAQIVVSVYDRAVKQVRAYAWSAEKKDFIEMPLIRERT